MNFLKRPAKYCLRVSLIVLCLFTVSMILESCKKSDDQDPAPTSAKQKHSGEDLYRAIYYSEGDLAKEIKDVNYHYVDYSEFFKTDEERKAVKAFQDHLVEEIGKKFPEFFSDFGTKLQSGDPVAIQQALKYADGVNAEVIVSLPEVKSAMADIEKSKALLGDVDLQQFVDENNKLDRAALESFLKEKMGATGGTVDKPTCASAAFAVAVNIAMIWNIGVLVNVAAGVNLAFAVNTAFGINAAAVVNYAYAVNRYVTFGSGEEGEEEGGCGGGESRVGESSLQQDVFVAGLAKKLSY